MNTLPKIIRDAALLLADQECESVVIARGDNEPLDARSSAYQMRLHFGSTSLRDDVLVGETRSWLGEQWSMWREQRGWLGGIGFDTDDVLATDWRIM